MEQSESRIVGGAAFSRLIGSVGPHDRELGGSSRKRFRVLRGASSCLRCSGKLRCRSLCLGSTRVAVTSQSAVQSSACRLWCRPQAWPMQMGLANQSGSTCWRLCRRSCWRQGARLTTVSLDFKHFPGLVWHNRLALHCFNDHKRVFRAGRSHLISFSTVRRAHRRCAASTIRYGSEVGAPVRMHSKRRAMSRVGFKSSGAVSSSRISSKM